MQKSGYTDYIESEKASLKEKRENNEISQNVYEAYLEDLNNETLELYLKKTDKAYYLAKYRQNQADRQSKGIKIASATMGMIFALAGAEITQSIIYHKKARKLEKQESDSLRNHFGEIVENNSNLIDNVEQKTYNTLE